MDKWAESLGKIRDQHKLFDDARVVRDHYIDKVAGLQEAFQEAQRKGKSEGDSNRQKRERVRVRLVASPPSLPLVRFLFPLSLILSSTVSSSFLRPCLCARRRMRRSCRSRRRSTRRSDPGSSR